MQTKIFVFSFIFLIILSLIPVTLAQIQDFPELDVAANPSFTRLGGSVNVSLGSNMTGSFLCVIVNPLNVTVYSKYYSGNATFLYAVPSVYGLYTVTYGNVNTWFWMQNESGLQSRSLPYSFSWKGVDYTVNANYTVTAVSGDGMINVDWVGSLIGLLNNPTVTVTSSDNAVRLQVVKNPYRFDVWWYKQYRGLVFRANGSMSNAVNGRWNISALDAKWGLDCVRSGFLTYDWSDLRGQGVSFSLNKTSGFLGVSIPKNFDFYDSVFADGFESGDTSGWSGSNGSPTIVSSGAHHGSYAIECNLDSGAEEDIYRTLASSYTNVWGRVMVKFSNLPASNTRQHLLMFKDSSWNLRCSVQYRNDAGTYRWAVYGGSTYQYYTQTVSTDTWYCIELEYDADSDSHNLYIDGTLRATSTDARTESVNRFLVGAQNGVAWTSGVATFDCAVADTSYIGPESSSQNLSFDLTAHIDMTGTEANKRELFKSGSLGSKLTALGSDLIDINIYLVETTATVTIGAVLDWVQEGGHTVIAYATENYVWMAILLVMGFVFMIFMVSRRKS